MKPTIATPAADLAFRSLDLPGRNVVTPVEISLRLGISLGQVHALMDEGEIASVTVGRKAAKRSTRRVPIESYRDFITRRCSGEHRLELLRQLPRPALEELRRDLDALLAVQLSPQPKPNKGRKVTP